MNSEQYAKQHTRIRIPLLRGDYDTSSLVLDLHGAVVHSGLLEWIRGWPALPHQVLGTWAGAVYCAGHSGLAGIWESGEIMPFDDGVTPSTATELLLAAILEELRAQHPGKKPELAPPDTVRVKEKKR